MFHDWIQITCTLFMIIVKYICRRLFVHVQWEARSFLFWIIFRLCLPKYYFNQNYYSLRFDDDLSYHINCMCHLIIIQHSTVENLQFIVLEKKKNLIKILFSCEGFVQFFLIFFCCWKPVHWHTFDFSKLG